MIWFNSWCFCCLFLWCSCVSRTADKKLQNTVDLFSEINPKVCVTYSIANCICFFYNLFKGFIKSSVQESKHKRTDRSVLCCLRKAQPGISWPRLTKLKEKVTGVFWLEQQKQFLKSLILLLLLILISEKYCWTLLCVNTLIVLSQVSWLSVDFINWRNWEEDSDDDLSSFDRFSEVRRINSRALNGIVRIHCSVLFLPQMINKMGGEDLPDLEGGDDEVFMSVEPCVLYC